MRIHHAVAILFFLNLTAPTEIYTLSLHDALPIYRFGVITSHSIFYHEVMIESRVVGIKSNISTNRNNLISRSEERFSRNAETDLVCRLLLEKKKNVGTTLREPRKTLLNLLRRLPDD